MADSPATERRPARWRFLVGAGIGFLAVVAGGAVVRLRPSFDPDHARARATRRLELRDHRRGLAALSAYGQRFAEHALGHGPIEVGEPIRMRVEFRPDGLLVELPARPLPASAYPDTATATPLQPPPCRIEQGPTWVDATRLAYVAVEPGGSPSLLLLDTTTCELVEQPVPQASYTMTFEATAALLGRPDAATAYRLKPNLAGATQPRLLAVSPDGSWLIFRARASGERPYELWRTRPDGSDAARLATLDTACAAVSFSPDGSRLAFFDGPRVRIAGLADEEAQDLRAYEVAAVLQPAAPCWSPDGRSVAYGVGSAGEWRLVTCPLDDPDAARERVRLTLLLDLEWIASDRFLQSQQVLDEERWVISIRTDQDALRSRVLVEGGRHGRLSADGRMLAYHTGDAVRVLRFYEPLPTRAIAALPAAELPERPAGPPAPASPPPDDAAPSPPPVPT